jgi:hypothetical protein
LSKPAGGRSAAVQKFIRVERLQRLLAKHSSHRQLGRVPVTTLERWLGTRGLRIDRGGVQASSEFVAVKSFFLFGQRTATH